MDSKDTLNENDDREINVSYTIVFFFLQMSRNGVADRSGMRPGDGILQINNVPATYLDHEQAKMEIIRSGNELDFVVQR